MAVIIKKWSLTGCNKRLCSTEVRLDNISLFVLDNTSEKSGLSYSVKGKLANLGALV